MYVRLRVKYPLFLSDGNETWTFSTYLRKILKFRFRECPSSGSRVVPYRRIYRQTDRQTDMAKTPENYGLRTGSIPVLRLQARVMPGVLGPMNTAVCKSLGLRRALPHTSTWVGAGLVLSWGQGPILSPKQWFIFDTGRYDIVIKMWHKNRLNHEVFRVSSCATVLLEI